MKNFFKTWKQDLPASLVVFLVALPLCLGVGLASTDVDGIEGLPNLFTGIIAGVIGGIVVGFFSGSRIGVSGPAAGLILILVGAITTLGSYQGFLVAVVLAGLLQVIAGFLGLGIIGNYFPTSVIKGMLAAIGITLILKEIPHAIGYDKDFVGDFAFWQKDGYNTFTELLHSIEYFEPGAVVISLVSLAILIFFETKMMKKIGLFKIIPGALIVVVVGVLLNGFFQSSYTALHVSGEHLVELPVAKSTTEFLSFFTMPDFSFLTNINVYIIAGTIALVGSLETLLSVEATDALDPEKHHTPTNQELKAQGFGNMVSGMIGGLPITQVIVRSTANVSAGGKSKLSTIIHGVLLLSCVAFIPTIINKIPLASLAAILLMVGYKLARFGLFKLMYKQGWEQFVPFIATIAGVLLTDLLKGIGIGLLVAIFFILRKNFHNNYKEEETTVDGQKTIKLTLSEEVTFLNKASILDTLDNIPENTKVIVDGGRCHSINFDVLEVLNDFRDYTSKEKNLDLEMINIPEMDPKIRTGGH